MSLACTGHRTRALRRPFEDEVIVLAESYWRQKAADPEAPLIFFARLDIDAGRRTFGEYSLQQAPVLVHFGPTGAIGHPRNKFPPNAQYVSELDAENAALFVRERTDYRVTVHRSPWPAVLVASSILLALAGAAFALRNQFQNILDLIRSQVWLGLLAGVVRPLSPRHCP